MISLFQKFNLALGFQRRVQKTKFKMILRQYHSLLWISSLILPKALFSRLRTRQALQNCTLSNGLALVESGEV